MMKTMKLFSFACVLMFLLFVLPILVNTQVMPGCSFQGLDLQNCLNNVQNSINFDSCCMLINQVVETGFHCACSLLTSGGPLLTAPMSLQVSSCNISIPPPAQCRALIPFHLQPPPTDSALTMLLPPKIPILPLPASTPDSFLLPVSEPPPQQENSQFRLNSTTAVNYTVVQGEPLVINNTATILVSYRTECFSSGYKTINSMQLTLFLTVSLYSIMN